MTLFIHQLVIYNKIDDDLLHLYAVKTVSFPPFFILIIFNLLTLL
jgi:hypothetical protein